MKISLKIRVFGKLLTFNSAADTVGGAVAQAEDHYKPQAVFIESVVQ